VYETARARRAGLDAVRDVYGDLDPALGKALRGVQRAVKTLMAADRRVTADTTVPAAPAGRPRRNAAVPGGHPSHKQ
jgi:hypothetical protein